MSELFKNLHFNHIILHNVHKPDDFGAVEPTLSSSLTKLDPKGLLKLEERISSVLGSKTSSLEMDVADKGASSCFNLSKQLIQATPANFLKISGEIAKLHTKIHISKQWPDGTLVIISGTTGSTNKRCLIIIKAEQQAGFTETLKKGQIIMKYLENLILTPQSKLYKIGVFIESIDKPSGPVGDLLAHVFDSNIKANDDRSAARYFYSNFLGLRIPNNASQRTRDFFELTTEFIAKLDTNDDGKLDLKQALFTYLKVEKTETIETEEFGSKYLDAENHDEYSYFMKSKGFPETAISKDTKLINRQLARRKLSFNNDIKVTAPSSNFSDLVKILEVENEHTLIRVKGHLIGQI
ncbi:nucleoid-associated protein [Pseudomonas fragi]|uniref:nucleoid-associated protein n=1 Tax=Pseudomonas fragi TaxID=296 RepID=UPI0014752AD6|nr:nucleoid-associated protein [Pseudomonas fragi]NNB54201.1 nucleoid-associated protein [Pseudomonas fragi]